MAMKWLTHLQSLKIEYGFYDDTKHKKITLKDPTIYNVPYILKNCHVLSPKEVDQYKVATCREFSIITYLALKKYYKNISMVFFIWHNPNKNKKFTDVSHHYAVIYQEPKDNLWYWIENAWQGHNGIFGPYKNMKDAINQVLHDHISVIPSQTLTYTKVNYPIDMFLKMKKCTIEQFLYLGLDTDQYIKTIGIESFDNNNISDVNISIENNIFNIKTSYPYLLLKKMEKRRIRYGYWDTSKKQVIHDRHPLFFDDDYIESHCFILHPNEVWLYGVGMCWDISLMVYTELKNHSIDVNIPFAVWKRQKEIITHTPILFKYKNNPKWYWFEYSAFKFRGIHGPYFTDYRKSVNTIYTKEMYHPQHKLIHINYNIPIEKLLNIKHLTQNQFFTLCNNK
jgi:hypothetical protein